MGTTVTTERRQDERRRWLTPEETAAEFAAICADWPLLARIERSRVERREAERREAQR